jgi:hypothetical protein
MQRWVVERQIQAQEDNDRDACRSNVVLGMTRLYVRLGRILPRPEGLSWKGTEPRFRCYGEESAARCELSTAVPSTCKSLYLRSRFCRDKSAARRGLRAAAPFIWKLL